MTKWKKTWQISFKATKCSVIRISPSSRKKPIDSSYQLQNHNIETEDTSKYLGMTLTDNLSWNKHIFITIAKGNRSLGCLRRNFNDCTTQVKASIYTTIVRPAVEYASTVWDPYRKKLTLKPLNNSSSEVCLQ